MFKLNKYKEWQFLKQDFIQAKIAVGKISLTFRQKMLIYYVASPEAKN